MASARAGAAAGRPPPSSRSQGATMPAEAPNPTARWRRDRAAGHPAGSRPPRSSATSRAARTPAAASRSCRRASRSVSGIGGRPASEVSSRSHQPSPRSRRTGRSGSRSSPGPNDQSISTHEPGSYGRRRAPGHHAVGQLLGTPVPAARGRVPAAGRWPVASTTTAASRQPAVVQHRRAAAAVVVGARRPGRRRPRHTAGASVQPGGQRPRCRRRRTHGAATWRVRPTTVDVVPRVRRACASRSSAGQLVDPHAVGVRPGPPGRRGRPGRRRARRRGTPLPPPGRPGRRPAPRRRTRIRTAFSAAPTMPALLRSWARHHLAPHVEVGQELLALLAHAAAEDDRGRATAGASRCRR